MTLFKFLLLFSLVGGAGTAVGFKHFNSTTEVKNSFSPENSISSINLIIDDTKKDLKKTLSEKLDEIKTTIKQNNQLKITKSSEKKSTNTKFETAKSNLEKKKELLVKEQAELTKRISILNKKQQSYLDTTKKHFKEELTKKINELYKTFWTSNKESLEAQKKWLFETIPFGCTSSMTTTSSTPSENLDSYSCNTSPSENQAIFDAIKTKYTALVSHISKAKTNISTYSKASTHLTPSQQDAETSLEEAFQDIKTKNSKIDSLIKETNKLEDDIEKNLKELRDLEKNINDLIVEISNLTSESQLLQKNIDSIK